YDHSRRNDVLHKEILLPSRFEAQFAGYASPVHEPPGGIAARKTSPTGVPQWARDRAALWNLAERVEKRRNSRVAREYEVALPFELAPDRRIELARAFAREIAERHNVAVDLAVHAPRPGGDPHNYHAHLLATTREITTDGLGAKVGLDMSGRNRQRLGLPSGIREFNALRARWAELANEALREAGIEARIDHRSLVAQGSERMPRARLPWGAYRAERAGQRSEIAERVRARHAARVAARARRMQASLVMPPPSGGARPANGQLEDLARRAAQAWREWRAESAQGARSVEEVRRAAVQAWLSQRQERADQAEASAAMRERVRLSAQQRSRENEGPARDDELSL